MVTFESLDRFFYSHSVATVAVYLADKHPALRAVKCYTSFFLFIKFNGERKTVEFVTLSDTAFALCPCSRNAEGCSKSET